MLASQVECSDLKRAHGKWHQAMFLCVTKSKFVFIDRNGSDDVFTEFSRLYHCRTSCITQTDKIPCINMHKYLCSVWLCNPAQNPLDSAPLNYCIFMNFEPLRAMIYVSRADVQRNNDVISSSKTQSSSGQILSHK